MTDNFTQFLINPNFIHGQLSDEARAKMGQMLNFENAPMDEACQDPSSEKDPIPNLSAHTYPSSHLTSMIPKIIALTNRILGELESNLAKLLTLNPSRREAIALHLERLAGILPSPHHHTIRKTECALRRWIDQPRSSAQNTALKAYFEEVALIALGQIILLKNWSDRGIRKWSESDLGRLNWALSTALKPLVPLDRECWQITRPNYYSWYNPSPCLQKEIWSTVESWQLEKEGPSFLVSIFSQLRRVQTENPDPVGYDARFFKCLWEHMEIFGFTAESSQGALKRNKIIFSPTIRDGTLVRTGPDTLTWIGVESSAFQLMLSELLEIWWGPTPPPLWAIGTGLETHSKDQLAFSLASPKPSVLCRISEMEACDTAFVLEEQIIRLQSRTINALRLKEQLEKLYYFKKIKSPGTSLGDLQACVALSKLRPGGFLWWAREEALCNKDGNEMLNFILDRAKLVCEWDFSELEHSLPSNVPLFPKHFYLFQREINMESRLSNRPVRHSIQGQLRSHVELTSVLGDAFQSFIRTVHPRGQWTILSHPSPTSQRDWADKWPDPSAQHIIRKLNLLRSASLPLANFTTIRPTPEGSEIRANGGWSIIGSLRGFWLSTENDAEGRKLVTRALPNERETAHGAGYLVLVQDENWIIPLKTYLKSEIVQKWLDCHAERRGERWILNDQVIKWIPIPKPLLKVLRVPSAMEESLLKSGAAYELSPHWQNLLKDMGYKPEPIREALSQLSPETEDYFLVQASVFVESAIQIEHICHSQQCLFSLVDKEGMIRWKELLNILPKSECVALSIHPKIRLSGSLPPHLPIGRIERIKSPSNGILLSTESGLNLRIESENSTLLQMIWEQLDGLSHPTWNELLQYIKLPRKIEFAESTAEHLVESYSTQVNRLKLLRELNTSCHFF